MLHQPGLSYLLEAHNALSARIAAEAGFEVTGLREVRVPADATTRYTFVTPDWANRWPTEEVWFARKRRG